MIEVGVTLILSALVAAVVIYHLVLSQKSQIYKAIYDLEKSQQSMAITQRSQEKFMTDLESKIQATTGKFNLLKEEQTEQFEKLSDIHKEITTSVLNLALEQLDMRIKEIQTSCTSYHELQERQILSYLKRTETLEGFRLRTSQRLDELEEYAPEPQPKKTTRLKKIKPVEKEDVTDNLKE